MTTTMTEAGQRAARVAAGGTYLDAREPGWLHRIDLGKLDLLAPCNCVLGQLAIARHGDLREWSWRGICLEFGVAAWKSASWLNDFDLGFNAARPGNEEPTPVAEYYALTAEWRRYIERRRAAA